jgi:hypothetical protein
MQQLSERQLGRQQLKALIRKQWLVKRRSWAQTLAELLSPVLVMWVALWPSVRAVNL